MAQDKFDATVLQERGTALVKKVDELIGDSQAFIFTPLPSVILLTEDQYDSLLEADELEVMQDYSELMNKFTISKNKLFMTQHNAMEVEVVNLEGATDDNTTNA